MAILNLEAIPGLLIVGTDVQAWDAQLDDIAALAVTDSNFIVGDGTNWVAESGATARASLGLVAGGGGDIWVEKAGDTMTGPLVIDDNSATALKVEQDGVKDNTFIVDTTNGRVGISKTPSKVFDMQGDYAGASADVAEELFEIYDSNNVRRTYLDAGGRQHWYLSSTSAEVGRISYTVPSGLPGIVFYNPSGTGRSQVRLYETTGGLAWAASTGSSAITNQMILTTNGNVAIRKLSETFTAEGSTITSTLTVERKDAAGRRGIAVRSEANGAVRSAILTFVRSRASEVAVADNDVIGTIQFEGHDGTDYNGSASILARVDGAVSGNTVPMELVFKTSETRSNGLSERMLISPAGLVSIGGSTASAQLHVDQASTTAAIAVLNLDQADLSEEFIDFICTEGVGNAVEDKGGKTLTPTKFVRVSVNGVNLYLQAGTIA